MNYNNKIEPKKRKVKTVILILTHSCNLNCTYCYEHNKDGSCIDLERAKEIIENEMNSNDDFDREFEFFGGEPLLEFKTIVALHDFLSSKKWKKKWITMITTNGTLVHGKIKEWLYRHKETVKVALSADGTAEMHNINRSNSYGLIDFDFFAQTFSVVKMTVSTKTLPFLADGIIYLHKLGFKVVRANLAFGIDWSNDSYLSLFGAELLKLIDFYVKNPNVRPSDVMDLPVNDIDPQSRNYASRHCGAGTDLVAYDIDGTSYPCHTFAPISAGDEIAKKSLDLTFDRKICLDSLDDKCRNCLVANVCPNCYGINFSSTGDMYKKDNSFCRMIKVQFVANAYFKYKQYMMGLLNLTKEEEYRVLNNINLVQKLEL